MAGLRDGAERAVDRAQVGQGKLNQVRGSTPRNSTNKNK